MDIRKPFGVAMLALAAAGLTGCPKPEAEPATGGGGASAPPKAGQQLQIAVIPKGQANQFWQSIKAGAEAACAENNSECKMMFIAPNPENRSEERRAGKEC